MFLIVPCGRERLMVIAVDTELTAGFEEFASVRDEIAARVAVAHRGKRSFDLVAVRLNDNTCVLKPVAFGIGEHLRPPYIAVKIRRRQVNLVVEAREDPLGDGRGKIVNNKDLCPHGWIDIGVRRQAQYPRKEPDIRLIRHALPVINDVFPCS